MANQTTKPANKSEKTSKQNTKTTAKPPKKPKGVVKNSGKTVRAPWVVNLISDTVWLFCLAITVYLIIALASFSMTDPAWSRSVSDSATTHNLAGIAGAYFADVSYYLLGASAWWWIIAACIALYKNFRPLHSDNEKSYNTAIGLTGLLIVSICSPILEVFAFQNGLDDALPAGAGGLIGNIAATGLSWALGTSGSLLILVVIMLLGLSLLIQVSWLDVLEKTGSRLEWLWRTIRHKESTLITEIPQPKTTRKMVREAQQITAEPIEMPEGTSSNRRKAVQVSISPPPEPVQAPLFDQNGEAAEPLPKGEYVKPSIALLDSPPSEVAPIDPDKLQQTAERIEAKLAEFGIDVQVVSATAGPVITRFEIEPAQGVKGSQIVNLTKDLARSLSVESIRVVETIAGKNTMGIELPNEKRQNVTLSEVVSSSVFLEASSLLTVAIGKDIAGAPVVGDLAKMPHLLVSGMTGSGKSVGVNAMICSILFRATPDEVRFIMIDPKMLELSIYDGIPHLLAPVVTDMREAGQALNWCVAEMEKRYALLSHLKVRTLDSFNEKVKAAADEGKPLPNPFSLNPDEPEPLKPLPKIVVVIDELADLMMTERKSVEQQIARLAQKARAAGIHQIIATQRPSVDVITGLIKANVPTRLAFTVQSKIDSRTILDQGGAEGLLKYGDSLFLQPGSATPARLQSPFVSDHEAQRIVAHIKQQAPTEYVDGLLTGEATTEMINVVKPNTNSDELFDQAVAFVLESRKTSISSLQRHLKIGYNRAANLMEALENAGVISPPEVGGGRRILAQKDNL